MESQSAARLYRSTMTTDLDYDPTGFPEPHDDDEIKEKAFAAFPDQSKPKKIQFFIESIKLFVRLVTTCHHLLSSVLAARRCSWIRFLVFQFFDQDVHLSKVRSLPFFLPFSLPPPEPFIPSSSETPKLIRPQLSPLSHPSDFTTSIILSISLPSNMSSRSRKSFSPGGKQFQTSLKCPSSYPSRSPSLSKLICSA
jgi:hypothetical protein